MANRKPLYADFSGGIVAAVKEMAAADTIEVEAPIAPTFINNWVNVGGEYETAGYWKDRFGLVHLRGHITKTSGTSKVPFVLPEGYRPSKKIGFGDWDGSYWPVEIASDGTVTVKAWVNVPLNGVSFRP